MMLEFRTYCFRTAFLLLTVLVWHHPIKADILETDKEKSELRILVSSTNENQFDLKLGPGFTEKSLVFHYAHIDSIFIETRGGQRIFQTGNYLGFDAREHRFPYMIISLDELNQLRFGTYRVRVFARANAAVKVSLMDNGDELPGFKTIFFVVSAILIGIILALLVYNLFIYISTRETTYFYYALYISSLILVQSSLYGFSYQFLWPNNPFLNVQSVNLTTALVGLFSIEFIKRFIRTKEYTPKLHRLWTPINLLYIIAIITSLSDQVVMGYAIVSTAASALGTLALTSSLLAYRKKNRSALYFFFAWVAFILGVIIYILKDFGFIPAMDWTFYTMPFGAALETLLLSFALADRINVLKKEKEASQARAINEMRRNQIMVNEQNKLLEEKVQQRTAELENINKELSSTINNLKTTQTQLVDAEKMASLGQLTAGIAHEINNPINFVSSNIEPLKQDFSDLQTVLQAYRSLQGQSEIAVNKLEEIKQLEDELDIDYAIGEIDDLLKGIKEGANRTIDIVKSLRIFSRSEEKGIKPANLNDGLHSTLTILRSQLKNIVVDYQPGDLPIINGQIGRINQVFMNIITNAIQAINDKYKGKSGGKLSIVSKAMEDEVQIIIADNGGGIPQDIKHRIFEPFYTTKDVGQGTGLGLSISYGIIDDHRGHIEVETELGSGSSFIISIPVNKEARPVNSDNEAR